MRNDTPNHVCGSTAFTPFPYSSLEVSIGSRFTTQVARHRDCVALVDREVRLTYRELDEWTNGVVNVLADDATPVATFVTQGATYIAATLGALKCGRPYIPLEPSDPVASLRNALATCGVSTVLTDRCHRERAARAFPATTLVVIDDIEPDSEPTAAAVDADAIAYVFFTSGSTGASKGVYDSHRNVLHNILRYTNALHIAPSDGLTLLQGPAFSGCVSSQFGALLNGATSYPFRLRVEGLLRAAEWLEREPITIYHSVPSIFRAITAQRGDLGSLRVVRLEGDRATAEDVEFWARRCSPASVLANGLGTTETGLAAQLVIRHGEAVAPGLLPVGYAARDITIRLVDEARLAVPTGEIGEIAVSSPYLALGYWREPDLTAERFASCDGTRTYFTGDLGRVDPDGRLEYVGRVEGDLKVLGMRVAPAEIERELLRMPTVRDAAVTVRSGAREEGRVVAYVVPTETEKLDLHSVRAALSEILPSAMLPTALVKLDALPLSSNGKVDRAALPDPVNSHRGRAADSTVERWLAGLWAEVLSVNHVGVDDDFFALGGDSLAGAEIVARIEAETGRSLPLGALVRAPTVGELAELLAHGEAAATSTLTVVRRGEGLLPLILLHGNTGNTIHYADLVHEIGHRRPLWSLEYLQPEADLRVDAIVDAHLESLTTAKPEGPYLLVGFCYGAAIAHEMGCRLFEVGHDVRLALLGITPLEFPVIASSNGHRRWRRSPTDSSLTARARHHSSVVRRRPTREAPAYIALRLRNLAARGWRRIRRATATGASSSVERAQAALASHVPRPFPGRPLVVLHRDDADLYTSDPETEWADLGTEGAEIVLLPGRGHDMLEGRGAVVLADLLTTWAASTEPCRVSRPS